MVEDRIKQWIVENYGDISDSVKHNILLTFETYWDQFTFRYAEIKTLEIYPTPPPLNFEINTSKKHKHMKELILIQSELKAPKNQFNAFGKYKYRSVEDILEAVKPLLLKYECTLTIEDEIKEVGGIVFVESTASIQIDKEGRTEGRAVTAQAGIDINRKGMDIAQSFGSSSSYARKYCLNGLFLIDDTKDPDASNDHTPKAPVKVAPTEEQFAYIVRYLNGTDAQRKQALEAMAKYNFNKDQNEILNGLV